MIRLTSSRKVGGQVVAVLAGLVFASWGWAQPSAEPAPSEDEACTTLNPPASLMNRLYSNASVEIFYKEKTQQEPPQPIWPQDGPITVQLKDQNEVRLTVPLRIGNVLIPPVHGRGVILDTGSAGVTVDCNALLSSSFCGNPKVPFFDPTRDVYVTDTKISRCYGHGEEQSGFLAVVQVTLGTGEGSSVAALMPFALINHYSNKIPAGSGLVGIGTGLDDGLISPFAYWPYGETLYAGYILDASGSSPTLTVGIEADYTGFTTAKLDQLTDIKHYTVTPGIASYLWIPTPQHSMVTLDGPSFSSTQDLELLLDTGTPPGGGKLQLPSLPSSAECSKDCQIVVNWDGKEVVRLANASTRIDHDQDARSVIGLDFLLRNTASRRFLVDLIQGRLGFDLSKH